MLFAVENHGIEEALEEIPPLLWKLGFQLAGVFDRFMFWIGEDSR